MTFRQLISVTAIAAILAGCGAGPQAYDDSKIKNATDNAKVIRGIYDANGGNYDSVPEADKKKLIDILKSDKAAREAFDKIKNPPGGMGGAPVSGQPTTGN
jgi:hypothetical protein